MTRHHYDINKRLDGGGGEFVLFDFQKLLESTYGHAFQKLRKLNVAAAQVTSYFISARAGQCFEYFAKRPYFFTVSIGL